MTSCNICLRHVLRHSYHLSCTACKETVHLNCLPCVSKDDPLYTDRHVNSYYCSSCLKENFAFNSLDDDEFILALSEMWTNQSTIPFDILCNQELIFSPFDLNENFKNPLHDIDPDIQFYNEHLMGSLQSCNYYLENTFNQKIEECTNISNDSFSMLHVNIRSAPKNLGSLENYLNALNHSFTAIGLSETWLKEYNADRYVLEGYRAIHNYRPLRSGGGVSILVQDSLQLRSEYHCRCYLSSAQW